MVIVGARASVPYEALPVGGGQALARAFREPSAAEPLKPRLLDRVRPTLRACDLGRSLAPTG
jgi:hypothetical protein